jgi:hypothetical protein
MEFLREVYFEIQKNEQLPADEKQKLLQQLEEAIKKNLKADFLPASRIDPETVEEKGEFDPTGLYDFEGWTEFSKGYTSIGDAYFCNK